jgi:hypothetical protein
MALSSAGKSLSLSVVMRSALSIDRLAAELCSSLATSEEVIAAWSRAGTRRPPGSKHRVNLREVVNPATLAAAAAGGNRQTRAPARCGRRRRAMIPFVRCSSCSPSLPGR